MSATGFILDPPSGPSESMTDDMVGIVRGYLAALRDPCYGGVTITDDQIRERANAIVQGVLVSFQVTPLAEGNA